MASVLRQSWHSAPPVFSDPDVLPRILPILIATGAAALAWWRLDRSGSPATAVDDELRDAFRSHSLQAALRARAIRLVLPALQDAGIEPLLVKGWSAARLYPDPGLRPYGDIDLCVPDIARAAGVLETDVPRTCNVDLHEGGEHLIDWPFEDVLARSRVVDLDGVMVRIPSAEDHLRILCLHLLYHGAWRPLWLCDIGAALDSAGPEFDWDRFLGLDPRRAEWVTCALKLAERLLGANLALAPARVRDTHLPAWLERAVLREWNRPHRWTSAPALGEALARRPWRTLFELVRRWPDPIRASIACGASFAGGWRAPYQIRYAASRFGPLVRQVAGSGRR